MSPAPPENPDQNPHPSVDPRPDSANALFLDRVLDQTLSASDDAPQDPRLRAALSTIVHRHNIPGSDLTVEILVEWLTAIVSTSFGSKILTSKSWRNACQAAAGSLHQDPAWNQRLTHTWDLLRAQS